MVNRIIFLIWFLMATPAQSAISPSNNVVEDESNAKSAIQKNKSQNSKLPINQVQSGSDSLSNLMQVTFGLFVIILLITAVAWFIRRFGNFQIAAKGNLRIIGGLPLGARERVVLIQVGSEQIVLGVAPGRIEKIHVLENLVPIEESSQLVKSHLAMRLSEVIKGYKGK